MEHLKEKILLGMLPFWTPAIPPLGIACLKSFLKANGYEVATIDANMEDAFRDIYDNYFGLANSFIPKKKKGNFFNMGMEVMKNHLMAHSNKQDEESYIKLVKILYGQTFYTDLSTDQVKQLNSVLDLFYSRLEEFILENLEKHKPDVFGLSVFSGNLPASIFAFRLAKSKNPALKTIMGGGTFAMELAVDSPNYEKFMEKTKDFIDKIIIGEGEGLFLKYLNGDVNPEQRVYTLKDKINYNIPLDTLDVPDFSDFKLANYPQLGMFTSRSCPFQCSFCSETVHWGGYRKKNPAKIVQELKELYARHGIQIFMMGDSLLNIVVDGLANELIKENLPLYWDGYLRADPPVCEPSNANRWRKGGLYRARLGVESGSQHVLDIMNKKITVDQIKRSIRSLGGAGIKTTTYWICGHPGETEEDFQLTLDTIEELQDFIYEAECNPFKYYLMGQVASDKWLSEYERVLLYPAEYSDMLVTQTWVMHKCEPVREKIYERVDRFVEHCYRLGIPNPYSMHEIHLADERWKQLHKNAVPALLDFKTGVIVSENKQFLESVVADKHAQVSGDFNF